MRINVCEQCYDGKLETLTVAVPIPQDCDICGREQSSKYAQMIKMRDYLRRVSGAENCVYEVDLSKKYILSIPEWAAIPQNERERISEAVNEWCRSDRPFLVVMDGVKLVRVDEPEQIEVGSVDNDPNQ